MDELGGREPAEIEALQERELLQGDGPDGPGQRLAHRQAAVLERRDRLERRAPGGHVGSGQEPALGCAEAVDLLRDEALVPREPRLLDLLLARPAAALLDDAAIGRSERGVPEERARFGRREVEVAGAGPARDELLVQLDGRPDALVERVATLRVADGELEDVFDAPGPEVAQEEQPAPECPWDAGCEDARTRDELVPELVEALDRRRGGRDTLPAERQRLSPVGRPEDRRDLASRPVQVRLDDLQHEPGRDRRVERVAPALEHRHPGLRGEPVGRRDHPEGAAQLGARGEAQGRTTKYALNGSCSSRCTSTDEKPASARSCRAFCSPHIAPSPSPPWASDTVMQCMQEIM